MYTHHPYHPPHHCLPLQLLPLLQSSALPLLQPNALPLLQSNALPHHHLLQLALVLKIFLEHTPTNYLRPFHLQLHNSQLDLVPTSVDFPQEM